MSAVGPANGAQIALAEIPLFAGLAPGTVERLERFMARFEIASGERLFLQDDHSGRMHVIEHGRLEVQVELPAGHRQALAELGPGELLGETSLLGGGRRVATAVAREPTSGWVLDRAGFEMLRLDVSAGAVELMARITELAVARLRARYQMIAAVLGGDGDAPASTATREAAIPAAAGLATPDYLRGLLCFPSSATTSRSRRRSARRHRSRSHAERSWSRRMRSRPFCSWSCAAQSTYRCAAAERRNVCG